MVAHAHSVIPAIHLNQCTMEMLDALHQDRHAQQIVILALVLWPAHNVMRPIIYIQIQMEIKFVSTVTHA